MTLVIAVDPGGTSGIAVIDFPDDSEPEYIYHAQWGDPDNVWMAIQALVAQYQKLYEHVVLVVEAFDKRPGIVDPDMTPKYINRDIERFITEVEIVWQIPAAAKNLVKPPSKHHHGVDQLKRFGWYKAANRHANDAARHAIVYAVMVLKHKATILRGWPRKDNC